MCSRPMIIGDVLCKHATQMPLAQNDDVIQTLAAQGSDHSLRVLILPRAGRTRNDLTDTHAGDSASKRVPIDRVAISQQPWWGSVVRKRFNHLLCRPGRRWM